MEKFYLILKIIICIELIPIFLLLFGYIGIKYQHERIKEELRKKITNAAPGN